VQKQTSVLGMMARALALVAMASGATGGAHMLAAGQAPQTPPAQPDGPRHIVTYVEVAPASAGQANTLLKGYRDATRRGDGNLRAEVLQRANRPGQFVVVEQWRDDAAWKQHRQAANTTQFQEKLKGLRIGPYDERSHTSLATAPVGAVAGGSVLVVTHVDVIPPGQNKLREMLKTLADASRKEAGNVQFDVLQGVRQNHFTVLEGWRDQRAYESHLNAAHTKAFREELQPLAADGAPYDERLYRLAQ
jgi:quinol monooxygenase YgiN